MTTDMVEVDIFVIIRDFIIPLAKYRLLNYFNFSLLRASVVISIITFLIVVIVLNLR